MSTGKPEGYDDVQRIVLRPGKGDCVLHQPVHFHASEGGLHFIRELCKALPLRWGPSAGAADEPETALGLTFRGLEKLNVPDGYLYVFRHLAPAFAEGAPGRAASRLGDSGPSAATFWDPPYALDALHAIVTIHGSEAVVEKAAGVLARLLSAGTDKLGACALGAAQRGARLGPPPDLPPGSPGQYVHFGYRDGLTRPRLVGDSADTAEPPSGPGELPADLHQPGELLLGEPRDLGDNPWSLTRLPEKVRGFFRHGSFGALRQIEQNEVAFRAEVERWAGWIGSLPPLLMTRGGAQAGAPEAVKAYVKAKLCGRWPTGQVIQPADRPQDLPKGEPQTRADFRHDPVGLGCPLGAHIRRMHPPGTDTVDNAPPGAAAEGPRTGLVVHSRPRPLFRRGMPYGRHFDPKVEGDKRVERGLLGLFFCSSLEDQFEHLLGQWAERLPLGLPGDSRAKDPLIGAHDRPDIRFEVPRQDDSPLAFWGFRPFVHTRGTAYACYLGQKGLAQLLAEDWAKEETPWLQP